MCVELNMNTEKSGQKQIFAEGRFVFTKSLLLGTLQIIAELGRNCLESFFCCETVQTPV